MINRMKGQITLINLMVLICVMVTFFVFLPIILSYTAAAAPAIQTSSSDQPTKDILLAVVNLFPVVLSLAIIVTVLNYAIPRRETG